ncbi:MAG: hypothetical protein MUP63_00235 [Candidatus Nanohaloarchaeota archaeon QJJ-7]|nr:hypothetical protein [Candidatus Nanohaloarchaeota archaeon QJJ-7]
MVIDPVVVWNLADVVSAIILLAALILMAKFYQEYLEVGISELKDWKLITIGFAFYIAIKTHFTVASNILGQDLVNQSRVLGYPWYLVVILSLMLVAASILVFIGFYGLVKDYL